MVYDVFVASDNEDLCNGVEACGMVSRKSARLPIK